MTERISDDRHVIQVSGPLHKELWEEKRKRQRQLRRTVAFDEIIRDWKHRAEGLDLLAAHAKVVPSGS